MSISFRDDIVLWREPQRSVSRRIVTRGSVAVVSFVLSGVPGIVSGLLPWAAAAWVVWAVGIVAAAQLAATLLNLARNDRVLLVWRGSGVIEWPQTFQEAVLRRGPETVSGRIVEVRTLEPSPIFRASEPRVELTAAHGRIRSVPLHGTDVADFVDELNLALMGLGVRFIRSEDVPPPARAQDS